MNQSRCAQTAQRFVAQCFLGTASSLNSPSATSREYNPFEVLSVITAKAATSLTGASA